MLKERGEILKGNLPEYDGLDELDAAVTAKRTDTSAESSRGRGERRVRGRSARERGRRGRGGSRSFPEDDTEESSSDG